MKKTGTIIVIVIVFLLALTFGIVCNKKNNTSVRESVSITESICGTQSTSEMLSESNTNLEQGSEIIYESVSVSENSTTSESDLEHESESDEANNDGDSVISSTSEIVTYTATFIADGVIVNTVTFTSEDLELIEPKIPDKVGYVGYWSKYTLTESDITIYAVYDAIRYPIEYIINEMGVFNNNRTSYTIEDETFLLMPLSKPGYAFDGWFDDSGTKIDEIKKGTFGQITLYGKWSVAEYTITYLNTKDAVNNNPLGYTMQSDDIILQDLYLEGYVFDGWYTLSNRKKAIISKGSFDDITLIAKWTVINYSIIYEDIKGVYNKNKTSYNVTTETFNLLPLNDVGGYTFIGWFEDDKKIETIESGSVGDKIITAMWTPIKYTATFYADGAKVATALFTIEDETIVDVPSVPDKEYYKGEWESYLIVADDIIVNAVYSPINYRISYVNTSGVVNPNVTSYNYESPEIRLKDISINGYVFKGWYDGDSKVDSIPTKSHGDKVLIADWELVQYRITYISELEAVNDNITEYTIESENILLVDLKVDGYTFNGWYLNNNRITEIKKGTYGDLTLTARWSTNSYKVSINSNVSGVYYSGGGSYKYNSIVSITVRAYKGYVWDGWYNGTTLLYKGMTYSFSMPGENVSYTARFTLCESHNTDKNCVCIACGKIVHKVASASDCSCSKCGDPHAEMSEKGYCLHGEYIYLGYYPQTIKSSSITIKTSQPDSDEYYTGSDGRKYVKVVADPYGTDYRFSSGDTVRIATYYFKVQPIKWKILTQEDDKALLLCESIIDNRCFNASISDRTFGGTTVYANNWEYSDIRSWLNKEFYNSAFDKLSQKLIQSTYLDNKTTGKILYGEIRNKYALCQNNTTDKIFFLTYQDYRNSGYGFTSATRAKKASDFAIARKIEIDISETKYGQGYYWERTPSDSKSAMVMSVGKDGGLSYHEETKVKQGVVPAVWIKIS